MRFSLSTVLPLAMAISASAQGTTSVYTEPKTGIAFETYMDPTGYAFGIALPTTPSTDFVGLLVGKGKGWAGVSLGGSMINKLLIAAWPSGTSLISTFRETPRIGNPPEANGSYTMTPIAAGTYTNATHWSYAFLCKGCILADGTTFASNASTDVLGWAFATAAPTMPAAHGSALPKHSTQGNYGMSFSAARTAKYATYAALAGAPATTPRAFNA
ncbi:CBD9-like protein [Mollisia scopiformis]|uniref:CBD9-like protein n=1 Tax=Mollisia scopiformis TaxID=149040 RepID=A0A132B905_MOLSC|nr:CBD9-like protein [Mollisia scopiformis]KUJ08885.1 CBD9-like protein [Mollisia scopiformis]